MTSRSGRGRWQHVLEARKAAREALGHEPPGGDLYGPPKARTTPLPDPPLRNAVPLHPSERHEYVLTIGEAAQKLGISRNQLEAMIHAGTIEALHGEFIPVIPTREIERLRSAVKP